MVRYNAGSVKYQSGVKTLSAKCDYSHLKLIQCIHQRFVGLLSCLLSKYIPWLHASSDQIHSSDATVSYTLFSKWFAV